MGTIWNFFNQLDHSVVGQNGFLSDHRSLSTKSIWNLLPKRAHILLILDYDKYKLIP